MEDEKANAGEIQAGDTAAPEKAERGAEGEPATDPKADRSKALTQEEVNEIVRERLAKRDRAMFAKYGVSDEAGLDELFAKAGAAIVHFAFSILHSREYLMRSLGRIIPNPPQWFPALR